MIRRTIVAVSGALIAGLILFNITSPRADNEDGIVRVKSAYPLTETVNRLKKDVAERASCFSRRSTNPNSSTLLVFGNPPLGIQFLTSNADFGLDWPVQLLVHQDAMVMSGRSILILIGSRVGITSETATMLSRWLRPSSNQSRPL
jgi:hypothetical protein